MRRPERRNRKSGTKDFGWRKQNKMTVPWSWQDRYGEFRLPAERIDIAEVREVTIQGHELTILRERPRDGCLYPCSVDDVLHILSLVPRRDLEDLKIIAFRQPTRKQELLNPVWGRLFYEADFRNASGPAIVIEATEFPKTMIWSKKLTPEFRDELDRLRSDGHDIETTSRDHVIRVTPETARNTVLYRTVLHELGHWVDYMEKVVWVNSALSEDYSTAENLYFARPAMEKEMFAHRYADHMGARLRAEGAVPFDPRYDTR